MILHVVISTVAAIGVCFALMSQRKKDVEISNLTVEIYRHKQEKEKLRNLFESLTLEQEKAREEMDALREEEMAMTTNIEKLKQKKKNLQEEKDKLMTEKAFLQGQDMFTKESAEIRIQLDKVQAKTDQLEEEIKKATSEENKVRKKFEEKITELDNHLKRTNQVLQTHLMEEVRGISNIYYFVYNEKILRNIRTVFVESVNPLNVLHVFHKYNTSILTQHDIEAVSTLTKNHGRFVGAAELLSHLVRYKNWFPCLLQVLRDPLVKQEHVAKEMEDLGAVESEEEDRDTTDVKTFWGESNRQTSQIDVLQDSLEKLEKEKEAQIKKLTDEISLKNAKINKADQDIEKFKVAMENINQQHKMEIDSTSEQHRRKTEELMTQIQYLKGRLPNEEKLLLAGKIGNGKSATGNSILLLPRTFKTRNSLEATTTEWRHEWSEFEGTCIQVVDGPGISADKKFLYQNVCTSIHKPATFMKRILQASPDGFDAFLFVISFGCRFTEEDNNDMIESLKRVCAPNFFQHYVILVVTCGDIFDMVAEDDNITFEQWCSQQKGCLGRLISEVEGRVVLFDNKTKDEAKRQQQVRQLLDMVRCLRKKRTRFTASDLMISETQ